MSINAAEREIFRIFEGFGFVTQSPGMLPLLKQARRAAAVSDVTVLLEGETGTGKQVLAEAIHSLDDKRKTFPFITVQCSTISESLAESELFGHERGAFSGATSYREGLFQAAHRGTVFLDDVNDLPLPLQPKLLDVLQRGVVRRVGCDRECSIDVRVISAANQPLAPLVAAARFRQDLYHRLNVIKLALPPLRERRADLSHLTLTLAKRHSRIYAGIRRVAPELEAFLETCAFEGNVRELENSVQRMLFLKTDGDSLTLDDWTLQANAEQAAGGRASDALLNEAARSLCSAVLKQGLPYAEALARIERMFLEQAAAVKGQTRRELARRLNTSERTLYHKLRSLNVGRGLAKAQSA